MTDLFVPAPNSAQFAGVVAMFHSNGTWTDNVVGMNGLNQLFFIGTGIGSLLNIFFQE